MSRGRPPWAAAVVVACSWATLRPAAGQTGASVDFGFTRVRYDGYLPSGGASISPEFRLERAHVLAAARGTYLRYESGSHSAQVSFAGTLLSDSWRGLRAELSGFAGASQYADFASFSHLLASPRLHLRGARAGAWMGGTAGTTWLGGSNRAVAGLESGAWLRRLGLTWLISASTTHVGDTTYSDFQGTTHAHRGRVTFDGSLGVRAWSRGGGHGVYGEASAAVALNAWLSMLLLGGRYPTDPTRGSISGRYLGLALRLSPPPRHLPVALPVLRPSLAHHSAPPDPPAAVELRPCGCEAGITLVVHAPGAGRVEVAGEFTNWEAVALSRTPGDGWSVTLPLAAGAYRFNVRIDGGAWIVPAGVASLDDEFGGGVGLLRVP